MAQLAKKDYLKQSIQCTLYQTLFYTGFYAHRVLSAHSRAAQ